MDSFRPGDVSNPGSDAFRREAARNVQQNIASMKTQRELADAAKGDTEPRDAVSLEHGRAGRAARSPQDTVRPGDAGEQTRQVAERARGAGLLEEKERPHKRAKESAKRLADEGVPPAVLEASRQIVEGQIDPVRGPRQALQNIKTPEETGRVDMRPADFHAAMDIHDQGNTPLLDDEIPGLP
jgi:hypothetical protein